ncbi:MAG: hypothetical protein M1548_01910, partial [Actinobacteria bacterium]|nr:hypothetical protein [Actinomycetota bacterium]
MNFETFLTQFKHLESLTAKAALIYVMWGSLGGFSRALLQMDGVVIFGKVGRKADGRLCVNLGIFWALIAGAIAGVIIDHSPIMMFLAGAMGPAFLEPFGEVA